MSKDSLFEGLNPQQRKALLYTEGPLLVLACAGSGKTRVIAHKYAHLVKSRRFPANSILALTFTNKAANEMKDRISSLSGRDVSGSWVGTFHSQCNRLLRKEIKALGFKPDFSIYDEDDQHTLIRHILREFRFHEALFKGVTAKIGSLKSSLIGPDEFLSSGDGFGFDEKLAKVYVRYQDELKRCNALDFDDLIGLTVTLFELHPQVLERYQKTFSYILVDEFQDTNHAQYRLLKLLGGSNISVVGDDDQSIYRFRGADVTNVFNFEKDFPHAKVIRLEQNYRSTQNILDVASAVISRNPQRKAKRLWTGREGGEKVCHCWLSNEDEEARHVAKAIKELYLKGSYEFNDFAVLYRVNIQSRAVEEALRDEAIPYRIMGGISFYHRKEIKDIIAYVRLIVNQADNVSLRRIINCPPRGIGAATVAKIENEAKKKALSLFEVMKATVKANAVTSGVKERLEGFIKLIERLASRKYKTAAELIQDIVEKSGYGDFAAEERMQNVNELMVSSSETDINDFIDRVSLFTNLDDSTSDGSAVTLMTLHGAKGLEFPVVFITGLEEGVLPYFKAMDSADEINEERRLFYVGMTRAKDILWLTGASRRKLYARFQDQEASRFLSDIPRKCCEWIEKTRVAPAAHPAKSRYDTRRPALPYVAGCRVRHPKWGVGVVRDCYGDGEEQKVMVNFPSIGMKKLVLRFANLEKI